MILHGRHIGNNEIIQYKQGAMTVLLLYTANIYYF